MDNNFATNLKQTANELFLTGESMFAESSDERINQIGYDLMECSRKLKSCLYMLEKIGAENK